MMRLQRGQVQILAANTSGLQKEVEDLKSGKEQQRSQRSQKQKKTTTTASG